jgi:hypothetical protein
MMENNDFSLADDIFVIAMKVVMFRWQTEKKTLH